MASLLGSSIVGSWQRGSTTPLTCDADNTDAMNSAAYVVASDYLAHNATVRTTAYDAFATRARSMARHRDATRLGTVVGHLKEVADSYSLGYGLWVSLKSFTCVFVPLQVCEVPHESHRTRW